MDVKIHDSWKGHLKGEFEKPYFRELVEFVKAEYTHKKVYPPPSHIFRAFELCSFENVKVVILGQDPYHGAGQANGLCFSVNHGVENPPSLQNIFKEIHDDIGDSLRTDGCLDDWAQQGVLLLNATLTVVAGQAGSHQHKGWEIFTDAIIAAVSEQKENVVFLLWGKYAQEKGNVINREKHLVLNAAHPSPFSANNGFFSCKHFSKANDYLEWYGKGAVRWINPF